MDGGASLQISVILSERSESKDPDNIYVLIAVVSFLSML